MKRAITLFLALGWLFFAFSVGCKKTIPVEPTHIFTGTVTRTFTPTFTITETGTPTPTYTVTATVTCTITPNADPKTYDFEDATVQGWVKDSGSPAAQALSASSTQANNGSYSLRVLYTTDSSNDTVGISRSYQADPVNLSGKSISMYYYLAAAMTGVYHAEASLVNYDGTVLALANNADFSITSDGWYQAVFAVPAGVPYEMIKQVVLKLKDDNNMSNSGFIYIDDISWN